MEILSPASNMDHIKVAIDEQANAVYGGLKQWNARNKAINFSTEEYNYLIKELHNHNIKFYLTLNILMLDSEINEVIKILKNNELPDAFIVTDVGLINELHKEFPQIPLHFSTQFGTHNIDDINFVKELNGSRAILARELTLNEINKIKNNSDIELECFIWGSQCLSFSGLCFFGTLFNGGGGNRGKCIITCRDIYSINEHSGNYLYVPDMDCINLISKLSGIDCLKLEGRRRKPMEIKNVLRQIRGNIQSNKNVGYLFGTKIEMNNQFGFINSRTKPVMMASKLENINDNDICVEYENSVPKSFSRDYHNPNVMYIYTEVKKKFNLSKKNICLDLIINEENVLKEILYMNHKGDGHTFFGGNKELIEFNIKEIIKLIESTDSNINVYKIKYKRLNAKPIKISKKVYNEMISYIIEDCASKDVKIYNNNIKFNSIYLETNETNIVDEFINDDFVKIIYDIGTINNLKNIKLITEKYQDKIIYKLPLFNWNSEDIFDYLKLLENKEIMFTRFSQIYLCRNINFKKKYTDYTIYIWNEKTLKYLEKYKIDEFTASPELSYETNKIIFKKKSNQVILGGKLPLVYTRNCFRHLFNCKSCLKNQKICKPIKNEDKDLEFEIFCNDDFRFILNNRPILNDYSKVKLLKSTRFRYVSLGQDVQTIKKTISSLKKVNYYKKLKNISYWKNSYECNLLEGKE